MRSYSHLFDTSQTISQSKHWTSQNHPNDFPKISWFFLGYLVCSDHPQCPHGRISKSTKQNKLFTDKLLQKQKRPWLWTLRHSQIAIYTHQGICQCRFRFPALLKYLLSHDRSGCWTKRRSIADAPRSVPTYAGVPRWTGLSRCLPRACRRTGDTWGDASRSRRFMVPVVAVVHVRQTGTWRSWATSC